MSEFEYEDEDKGLTASQNVIVKELQKLLENFKEIAIVYNYYGSKKLENLVPVAKLCRTVGDEVLEYYDKQNYVFGENGLEREDGFMVLSLSMYGESATRIQQKRNL